MPSKTTPRTAAAQANAAAIQADPRWAQLLARDAGADGQFCYAVKTTGVYCRPSCGSRTPRPENVRFFATPAAAAEAGFRPCQRCQPDQPSRAEQHARLVARLCRQIEAADTPPSLQDLAQAAQLSTYHLHRMFKAVTGVTPKAYAAAHRAKRLRQALQPVPGNPPDTASASAPDTPTRPCSITEAMYAAGFNSSGRFHEASAGLLGMTPTAFRAGGTQAVIRFAIGQCSLGAILVAASERGVCAILLGDAPEVLVQDLQDRFPKAELIGGDAGFEQWVAAVVGLVEQPGDSPGVGFDLPLDIRGTAFQQRVWQALRGIPAGTTVSYTELARRIGAPKAVRAVASACAANALAVAIPCHRVVRTDGNLSGYRWGVARKRALLEREAEAASKTED